MITKRVCIALVVFASLIACEKNEPYDETMTKQVGDTVMIELEANWSTGYHWIWTNGQDISIVDSINHEYEVDNPGVDGSPGTEVWYFEAVETGEETLVFDYVPPGVSETPGEETKRIRIKVD